MSEKLYYQDAYTVRFTAHVVGHVREDGRFGVILDRSYFYPTSGGQPADWGTLNDCPVNDVTIRPGDGHVVHWLAEAVTAIEMGAVTAVIDWPRRFDHMQHHTGQHVLSQAFIRTADAPTVAFHLSQDSVTIDLDIADLTPAQIAQAEQLANQIVWEDRPVHIRMVTLAKAQTMPLRKIPPVDDDRLRLIDIEEFDLTACGGTHVARTGAVGLIKVVKLERRRGQVRIEFRCGCRALADYSQKHETVSRLMQELTTGQPELVTAVTNLKAENKTAHRSLKKMRSAWLRLEAQRLLAAAEKLGDCKLVVHVFDEKEGIELPVIGNQLVQNPGVVALLGMAGTKSQLLFCRSENAPGEMNELLKLALQQLGKGGGGGSARMAQGGGPAVENGRLRQAIAPAAQQLHKIIPT